MSQRTDIPFNIEILNLTPKKLEGLRPTRSLDIMEGSTLNFHPDGLYSTFTFGKVGDDRRARRYSFIDVKISIFHPIIYKSLLSLKRLYGEIISGKEYATWNDEIKDFEKSSPLVGNTGFEFFVTHWKDIAFNNTGAESREQAIKLIAKYKNIAMTRHVLVMPAGLRDIELKDNGSAQSDEINEIYRSIISISNTITEAAATNNPTMLDSTRYKLQMAFIALYENLQMRIDGKKKFMMAKWASRGIFNSTRNVFTSLNPSSEYLGGPKSVGVNDTVVGLYQALKAILPITLYQLRNGFLLNIFISPDQPARLINKDTLEREDVVLKPTYYDKWATNEGLEKLLTSFNEETIRHKPIVIEGRYLALIYKGPDGTFKIIHDINEVPHNRDRKDVHPITFCELLYCSTYTEINKYPALITRYPIAGMGSIYPSMVKVKTTTVAETRVELDHNWQPMGNQYTAYEFPIVGKPFTNSLSPHHVKLDRLTADFDGDTGSYTALYTDESVNEITSFLKTKKAYLSVDGKFLSSVSTDTTELLFHNLSI